MKKIFLKKEKENILQRKHPWIYSGALEQAENGINSGDTVEIIDSSGKVMGYGFYFPSSLQVKIFHRGSHYSPWVWKEKIHAALAYRRRFNLPSLSTNSFRCFFGEADGIPGLVADFYNDVLVLQFHHSGLKPYEQEIKDSFLSWKEWNISGIVLEYENQRSIIYQTESLPCPIEILEHDLIFHVDWKQGQKTGFFLDQRDNRIKCMHLAKGREVLNLFCYTGAFTLYALQGGAKKTVSVDSSAWALEWMKKHLMLNEFPDQEIHCEDVFDYLKSESRTYDLVICDPPAFAKNLKSRHNALMAYKRLNSMAMQKTRPGGIFMTFSCSGVVSRDLFYHTVVSACLEIGQEWNILGMLYPGFDHPVSPYFPEGDYLKGMMLIRVK